jgi:hypothetical protein
LPTRWVPAKLPGVWVAIAACRRTAESPPDDLYPDTDAGPLADALAARGASVRTVSWDDPTVDWSDFDRVVVSSTWDSVDRPTEYLAWTDSVGDGHLVNPARVLRWGLDKTHQIDLAAVVPVIPTTWVRPGQPWAAPDHEFVVKPAVSAGGRSTVRYHGGDLAAAEHVAILGRAGQTAMVQPYVESIDRDGESDLIFVGGRFSHAVGKLAGLPAGRGIIDTPWEQMAWSGPMTPSPEQLAAGAAVVDAVRLLAGDDPVYARVDLLAGSSGDPVLLEVEVVDPMLSLDSHPAAADALASAVLAGL